MITIFAIPKAFRGHIGIIQRNAIRSWTLLHPEIEIILFGQDEGVGEIAAEYGLRHVPHVACTEYGTPLISDVFAQAQSLSNYDIMCYINSDIILLNDFVKTVKRVQRWKHQFLMIGQRWDIDIIEPLSFTQGWDSKLRTFIKNHGTLHDPAGIDYFLFSKNIPYNMPPFAIGRPAWDNWFLYRTRKLGVRLVDATNVIMAVHQNHGYAHVPRGTGQSYEGPEAIRNRLLSGGNDYYFTLNEANWVLSPFFLMPSLKYRHLQRLVWSWYVLFPYRHLVLRRINLWLREELSCWLIAHPHTRLVLRRLRRHYFKVEEEQEETL